MTKQEIPAEGDFPKVSLTLRDDGSLEIRSASEWGICSFVLSDSQWSQVRSFLFANTEAKEAEPNPALSWINSLTSSGNYPPSNPPEVDKVVKDLQQGKLISLPEGMKCYIPSFDPTNPEHVKNAKEMNEYASTKKIDDWIAKNERMQEDPYKDNMVVNVYTSGCNDLWVAMDEFNNNHQLLASRMNLLKGWRERKQDYYLRQVTFYFPKDRTVRVNIKTGEFYDSDETKGGFSIPKEIGENLIALFNRELKNDPETAKKLFDLAEDCKPTAIVQGGNPAQEKYMAEIGKDVHERSGSKEVLTFEDQVKKGWEYAVKESVWLEQKHTLNAAMSKKHKEECKPTGNPFEKDWSK